ncbi:histidine phosphatase family protein [Polynucleobacter wuianus]|uniref:Histidine phosphatase family protein n=1 Tax=Polynucleobacter wuianus TaxID=1743168 RepID=A0A191UGY3_9BURK|nr:MULTISPECIES: histidine phosphatase family protein [Polynucleobacter]ANJ00167.1 histidine phosphatase family protein [Polynucleobacter wuianus]MBU3553492.1 histidine phosphatase family protein [Polynucleobacter sp. MWH-Post4-6-1]MBU3610296.1 histidine phosphatase family protein [Polynucleobacter wuianus]
MKLIKLITPLLVGSFLALLSIPASASLANDLNDGQHVLLIRHADAPGYGDPAGYQLDKCSTQRNLGDRGRKQAVAIGQWLTNQEITSAKVFSSAWCRCLDTARLINKGLVTITPTLGSFFDDMSLEKQQTQDLERLIQAQLKENSKIPLILVTHHVNIQAYTGKVVNVGDMVLVKVDKNGRYLSHQIYPSPSY